MLVCRHAAPVPDLLMIRAARQRHAVVFAAPLRPASVQDEVLTGLEGLAFRKQMSANTCHAVLGVCFRIIKLSKHMPSRLPNDMPTPFAMGWLAGKPTHQALGSSSAVTEHSAADARYLFMLLRHAVLFRPN